MGGKPNQGTPKDRRLAENKSKPTGAKPAPKPAPMPAKKAGK